MPIKKNIIPVLKGIRCQMPGRFPLQAMYRAVNEQMPDANFETLFILRNKYISKIIKEFKKIDKDILRITGADEALGYEPPALDKPETEDDI